MVRRGLYTILISVTATLSLLACGIEIEREDDGITKSLKTPTNNSFINPRVIYGDDDRLDLYDVDDLDVLFLAEATAILVSRFALEDQGNGYTSLNTDTYGKVNGLCPTERFYHQPSLGFCSGFLVSPDTVLTAGHCVRRASDCSFTRFVFGFGYHTKDTELHSLPTSQIYSCKEIKRSVVERPAGADYAIIKLDREVEGITPLQVRNSGQIQVGEPLFVIGNPSGLPTKVAAGANVRSHKGSFFVANLDTYRGNSGSAVFNANTLEVEGILVRGETDFRFDGNCRVSYVCEDDGCRGEDVTNIMRVH